MTRRDIEMMSTTSKMSKMSKKKMES